MEIHHRTDRSIFSLVLQTLIRPFKPRLVAPKSTFPAGSPRLKHDRKINRAVRVVERQQQDVWLYDITAHNNSGGNNNNNSIRSSNYAAPPPRRRLHMYYIAGGGWQSPPSGQHWKFCAELVRNVPGLTVTVVSAPLAPSSPAVTAFPVLRRLFASLLEQGARDGEQAILAGDSSGGNLVLCLALDSLRSEEDTGNTTSPKPLALLAISPAVDLRPMETWGKEMQVLARRDPVLTVGSHNSEAAAWAAGVDPACAWISPAAAADDVGGVLARARVRLIGVTGGYDILTPAALGFRDACAAQGVGGAWLHWERQMHCFPLAFMYGLPEAVWAKDWVVEQIRGL
ncbi:hypothetical protein N8I77_003268 [Diaporthe amygdali]|uniref:Alpha/beta hydrolase fold-3 domain-containing protein n=1 Tax=Phomopsis amygdali TaxID=1214568 RepID=A0AAD9SJJ9_PHOAM|nr:hypothetical protein N8I77_003268 [Diaporthe amygdali]